MRLAVLIASLALGSALAVAQVEAPPKAVPKSVDSPHSDGRTVSPETKGVMQPQGPTGPTETTSGGSPPESPQGQTPPGMQSAPGGSQKTVVDPEAAEKGTVVQSPAPGKQPSASAQPSADTIFQNGVLTVEGADPDNQAAPAKYSKRTDAADQLPIAAYALKHLSDDQRTQIYKALRKDMALTGSAIVEPVVGAEVSAAVVLNSLEQLPGEITKDFPELRGLSLVRDGGRLLLVSPTMHRVLAVMEP